MSNPTSSAGGFELKHRIVGAAILIGFGVIVLPMVLGGPDPDLRGGAPEPAAAQPETKVFVSKITPIGGGPASLESVPGRAAVPPQKEAPVVATRPSPSPDKPASVQKTKPVVSKPAPVKSAQKTAVAPPPAKVVKETHPPAVERGWIVQVGVFAQSQNAQKLQTMLEKRGFQSGAGPVKRKGGTATRVWIGPYPQRVEAARMRARLEQATGEKGLIVAYP